MKKYLLGLFAIVLAVGFSAFSVNRANVNMKFNGNASIQSQRQDPTKYSKVSSVSCPSTLYTCSVLVDEQYVDASGNFISSITITSSSPSTQLVVKDNGTQINSTTSFRSTPQ